MRDEEFLPNRLEAQDSSPHGKHLCISFETVGPSEMTAPIDTRDGSVISTLSITTDDPSSKHLEPVISKNGSSKMNCENF